MAFRTIMITKPCYLSTRNNQLYITQDEDRFNIPLEDIACIVIDNYAVTMSATLLANCASYNVVLISCDSAHLPNGIFHSYLPHSRQRLILDKQLGLSVAFKKRLWQKIVIQKIINQSECLCRIDKNHPSIVKLNNLAKYVTSGDSNNHEAQASKIYFEAVFGGGFTRIKKNSKKGADNFQEINASLNYTYSIIRSLICRSLVGYGFLPTLGLFHCSELNAFNLADDFIEPFRAYIDWYICTKALEYQDANLLIHKPDLVNVLNHIIHVDDKATTVLNACDVVVKSFANVINTNDVSQLKLPCLPIILEPSNMD